MISDVSFMQTIIAGVFFTMGGILLGLACFRRSYSSGMPVAQYSVGYVTGPSEEFAKKLAKDVVTKKLAACVNIIPKVTSIYEWDNKINEETEVLMMIKTRTSKIPELTDYVKANHPYEVCEVISVPIGEGNKDYFNWISSVVPA